MIQLNRTKTAAEAATDAVSFYRERVENSDTAVDASRIITLLELTLSHVTSGNWLGAASVLWEAQKLIGRVKDGMSLPNEQLVLTEKNATEFLKYVQVLEDRAERKLVYDASDLKLVIRTQINVLEDVVMRKRKDLQNG